MKRMLPLRCLNQIHRFSRALVLFSTTPTSQPQTKPTTFDHATVRETLGCYGNDWNPALEFFNWVETECHFSHTTDTYNRMIDILGMLLKLMNCVLGRTRLWVLIWDYVKTNNLQNPANKKEIICDAKLKAIFDGKEKVGILEVPKLLSTHFVKP